MRFGIMFCVLLFVSQCFSQEIEFKHKPPTAEEQSAYLRLVAEVYKSDYESAKTAEQRVLLSRKMLGEALATKNDTVGRFVLFSVAKNIAVNANSLATAFHIIDCVENEFNINALAMKVESADVVVTQLSKPVRLSPGLLNDKSANINLLWPIISEAVKVDDYEAARNATELISKLAGRIRELDAVKKQASKASDNINKIENRYNEIKNSFEKLSADPNNAIANSDVGIFYCFYKGDWNKGLPMLAKGVDDYAKTLATNEIQDKSSELTTADKWWDYADTKDGLLRDRIKQHAITLYQKKLPSLSGLQKAIVESKLESAGVGASFVSSDAVIPKQPEPIVIQYQYLNKHGNLGVLPVKNGTTICTNRGYFINGDVPAELQGLNLIQNTQDVSREFSTVNVTVPANSVLYMLCIDNASNNAKLMNKIKSIRPAVGAIEELPTAIPCRFAGNDPQRLIVYKITFIEDTKFAIWVEGDFNFAGKSLKILETFAPSGKKR